MGHRLPGDVVEAPKRRNGSMNSVHLIGRLATDVEVKEVDRGSKVSSFILAVDRNAEEAEVAFLRHLAEK